MKLCFIASSGGHLAEINQLKEISEEYDSFLITEQNDFDEAHICSRVYHVSKQNRKEVLSLPKFVALWFKSPKLFLKEKPDCIITTGALICYPICCIAKMFHRKVVYIESFARFNTGSLTGKLMYNVADLFIVQSEYLLDIYPKAVYCGCIF